MKYCLVIIFSSKLPDEHNWLANRSWHFWRMSFCADCHGECLMYWDLGLSEIVLENALCTQTCGRTDLRLSLRMSWVLRSGAGPTRDCHWERLVYSGLGLKPTLDCHWERLVYSGLRLNQPEIVTENVLCTHLGLTGPTLSLRMSCELRAGIF